MTLDIGKTFFLQPAPEIAFPHAAMNQACNRDLMAVQNEREALERGDLSQFDPSKLRLLFSYIKVAIQEVRNKEISLDALNGALLDLIAIEEAIESYLTVAKKVIES